MSARLPPLGRDAYPAWHRLSLRNNDNNSSGHVDNTVFYMMFDEALIGWLVSAGLLSSGSAGMPFIAQSGCRFLSELVGPVAVDVGFGVTRLGTSSMAYRLGVFRADSAQAVAEGDVVQVLVGRGDRRPMALPAAWRDRLGALFLRG